MTLPRVSKLAQVWKIRERAQAGDDDEAKKAAIAAAFKNNPQMR